MKIIVHYPGLCHFELNKNYTMSFARIWTEIISEYRELSDFDTFDKFYSRFILFKNGVRIYNFDNICSEGDIIVIVASNKQTLVDYYTNVKDDYHICNNCSKEEVVYLDTSDKRNLDGVTAFETYCTDCFLEFMREKAFTNIQHSYINDLSIIDLGLSGERDSSLALHFLNEYRTMNQMSFQINCVFNQIGLGTYDNIRLAAARKTMKSLLQKDQLQINNIGLPIVEDFNKLYKEDNSITTKYCDLCVRASGFRTYGSYIGEDLYIATGGGTIEDKFVSRILNKGEAGHRSIVNFRSDICSSPRRLTVLEGISEDSLALYAAIKRIDYCIADCPVAQLAPNYLCRKYALNPIKAIAPWVYSSYGDNNIIDSHSIFGHISSNRKIEYPTKYIKDRNNDEFKNLGCKTIKEIIEKQHLLSNSEELDVVEKKLCDCYEESENKWIEGNIKEWIIALEDPDSLEISVQLSKKLQVSIYESIALIYDNWVDRVYVLALNKFEEQLLNHLSNKTSELQISQILDNYSSYDHIDIIRGLQRLTSRGIIETVQDINLYANSSRLNMLVIDTVGLFNSEHNSLLLDCLGNIKHKSCQIINNKEIIEDEGFLLQKECVVFISKSFEEIKSFYEKISCTPFKANIIYIHIAQPMTVYLGRIECLFNSNNFYMPVSTEIPEFLSIETYRIQIISILSEIYFFDDCTTQGANKGFNVLYYMDFISKKKIKQVIPCKC